MVNLLNSGVIIKLVVSANIDSHKNPSMKYLLMKFVFRINGGINLCFVCWGNRVIREQYVAISSGLVAVASFFLGFAQIPGDVERGKIASLCFWS